MLRGTGDGAGIDGRKITVRMLMRRQTSGPPEFLDATEWKEPFPDLLRVAPAPKPTARAPSPTPTPTTWSSA
ncbi:hypothetical protein HCN51_25865 [Nonomuraea sp. FMUSA5-5]|uniref:Uncharacterized protein n=1 Tax=Nonomuraea composti TaxID=2720023 RepID=A0ABX1B4T9_9ACTN|nr:hypothetical protein [Nonomuraea sp. FMUSA5-5]NJP92844.1 hypothetical protein [Nonomuraea sp. FMUSA5-5]